MARRGFDVAAPDESQESWSAGPFWRSAAMMLYGEPSSKIKRKLIDWC
jgi:hypothetical protein